MIRVVVDAMGSDRYPQPDVAGAVIAAKELGSDVQITLVGNESRIYQQATRDELDGLGIKVKNASQVVEMTDQPARAVKNSPDSSMVVGMNFIRDGEADAFVSAGNTGAALAAGLFRLGRIKGIKRPGLAALFPFPAGAVMLIDGGANADCKPDYLVQFAMMGSAYMRLVQGISNPRVATLSNGEEEGKGNLLIKDTTKLLRESSMNYIGNVEPKEFVAGEADVVVCDGFTGNVVIKQTEAALKMLVDMLRTEIKSGVVTTIGGLLAKPAFSRIGALLDPAKIGGAVLLGVDGTVVIGHGRSDAEAVKNAIHQAVKAHRGGVVDAIKTGVAELLNQDTTQ